MGLGLKPGVNRRRRHQIAIPGAAGSASCAGELGEAGLSDEVDLVLGELDDSLRRSRQAARGLDRFGGTGGGADIEPLM